MNGLSAEGSRKTAHVAVGSACLAFPWIFHSPLPVVALAAAAVAVLAAVRAVPHLRAGIGRVLYGVARRSYGEFAFAGGVAAAFVLANGDAASYVIPVAVLTFADAAAALIGTRYGLHRFSTPSGPKSIEGSLAFFLAAMLCVVVPLGFAGQPNAVAIAAIVSGMLMVVEASAWAGLDNIMIPLAGGLLVRSLAGGLGALV